MATGRGKPSQPCDSHEPWETTMAKETLTWTDVDIDEELNPKLQKLYKAYKVAQDAANKAREAFDTEFAKSAADKLKIDTGEQSIRVGHNWGKLAYAVSNTPTKGAAKKLKVFF
jgi:hypothetical protein